MKEKIEKFENENTSIINMEEKDNDSTFSDEKAAEEEGNNFSKRKSRRKNKVKVFFSEFGEWLKNGDIINVAVAFVVGYTFRAIVTSLVSDIVMPLLSTLGGVNLVDLSVVLNYTSAGEPNILRYGSFIQTIVDFLITAFAIFIGLRTFVSVRATMEKSAKVVKEKLEELIKEDNKEKEKAKENIKLKAQIKAKEMKVKDLETELKKEKIVEKKKLK